MFSFMKPLIYTPKEVARMFSVNVETIYRWAKNEVIPKPFRVGRQLRWHGSDLDDWIESHKA
jgi:excisionase family DNA binding protein